jgi:DNA-binding response OmpR family regulator
MLDLKSVGGAEEGDTSGDRLRIFFIEDDLATAQVFIKVLRLQGYEVRHAGSYQEALALADGEFDLLLSDIALPDGTGWDVMRHVRSRWAHIPGIALSGFGSEEDLTRSREAGFATHLTKPAPLPQLRAAIETVIRRRGPA